MATLDSERETLLFRLSPPLGANEYRRQLWASLITDPFKPAKRFSSFNKKSPIEMLKDIDPAPQPIKDYGQIMRWSRHARAEASVESVFKAYLQGSESEVDFRQATSADWYYMAAPEDQLNRLLANEEWARDAEAFIEKNKDKELFFVTAMLVAKRLYAAEVDGKALKGGAGVKVPNPHTGTNVLALGVDGAKEGSKAVAATFVEPQILAIGYHEVKINITTEEEEAKTKGKKSFKFYLSKICRLFRKPKHRLVGTLYNVDRTILYRLNMVDTMAKGNIRFFDDVPETKEETLDNNEIINGSNEPKAPASKSKVEEDQANDPFGKIVIIPPDIALESLSQQSQSVRLGVE